MCSIGKMSFGQSELRCHHHFVSKVQHRPYQIASKSLTTLKQLICQQISFSNTRRWQKIDEHQKNCCRYSCFVFRRNVVGPEVGALRLRPEVRQKILVAAENFISGLEIGFGG